MPFDPNNESATLIHGSAVGLLVGTTLSKRYIIEKELKRGGFGIVYFARDQQLHSRPVVIKVLLDDAYQSEYVVRKFRQEVEALSRIDHPGVVGIVDSGELSDGKPFIVMQYVDGVTLRSAMRPEGMDLERAAELIRQMGRALTAAHDKGIFHRDLKPENVMLQDLGHGETQVKIIDFGIAKIKDSVIAPSTATNIAAGTVAYMAPEQLSSRPVTAATDVYALGQVAYEMLTGRRAFNPETGFELLEMQRAGVRINPSDLRPSLPAEAAAVIMKSLSFEPNSRQARARDFGDELARTLGNSSVTSETVFRKTDEPLPTQLPSELTPLARRIDQRSEKTIPLSFPLVQPPALEPEERGGGRSGRGWKVLAVGLPLLLLAVAGVWYWAANRERTRTNSSMVTNAATRNLNHSLTVQKMRDGRPYQDQFESSGQEIFENGWKFRMNLSSPQTGYLYLLNEGPSASGETTFNVLFPAPSTNSGASYVNANQPIATGWMVFDENQGTEKFWVVWAANSVPELEAVKGFVNERDKGTINDSNLANAVRNFLNRRYAASKPEVAKDKTRKQTNVTATGDILVNVIELEHH
jgi:serine/threonine protein kinase